MPPRESPNYDRIYKMCPLLECITQAFSNVYTPRQNLSIDKTIITFKGMLSWIHNGYISNFKLYTSLHLLTQLYHNITLFVGKTPRVTEKGLGHKVVTELVSDYRNKGCTLFMDNYYSLPELFNDLDKGDVCMLSTFYDDRMIDKDRHRKGVAGMETIRKPKVVEEYNQSMNGVNTSDQMVQYYGYSHRIFFHLLDLSLGNANILYNEASQKPLHHMDFRLAVAKSLLQNYNGSQSICFQSVDNDLPLTLTSRCFPERIPKTSQYAGCHQCVVCGARKNQSQTCYR
uniref:PiggyBac transposable element-derived protein domain-containing protein n=1 Tax=Amphimedon queenslandica TaxID=400682 RepID=A0A1X7VDF6_AMPQE